MTKRYSLSEYVVKSHFLMLILSCHRFCESSLNVLWEGYRLGFVGQQSFYSRLEYSRTAITDDFNLTVFAQTLVL